MMFKKISVLTIGLCLSMSALAVDVATLTKQAESGEVQAQNDLSFYYYERLDFVQAFYWYHKAAIQGSAEAQSNLGYMFDKGEGTPQNSEKAFEWYQKSASQGLAKAQFNLALMYQRGIGVEKDIDKALYWYQKASNQNFIQAKKNLAVIYFLGEDVPKDLPKAVNLILNTANQQDAQSQFLLGLLYYTGQGVTKNIEMAKKWFSKACENGYYQSCLSDEELKKALTNSSIDRILGKKYDD